MCYPEQLIVGQIVLHCSTNGGSRKKGECKKVPSDSTGVDGGGGDLA